jgi:hypothetical protein
VSQGRGSDHPELAEEDEGEDGKGEDDCCDDAFHGMGSEGSLCTVHAGALVPVETIVVACGGI